MKNKQDKPDIEEIRIQASKVFDEFSSKLKGKPPERQFLEVIRMH